MSRLLQSGGASHCPPPPCAPTPFKAPLSPAVENHAALTSSATSHSSGQGSADALTLKGIHCRTERRSAAGWRHEARTAGGGVVLGTRRLSSVQQASVRAQRITAYTAARLRRCGGPPVAAVNAAMGCMSSKAHGAGDGDRHSTSDGETSDRDTAVVDVDTLEYRLHGQQQSVSSQTVPTGMLQGTKMA